VAVEGESVGHSPLAQFEIQRWISIEPFGVDLSFTNSALFMTIAVVLAISFLMLGTRRKALVPGRWQSVAELSYEFIANMIRDNVGNEGRKYFPFIFTLFMFVFFGNMLGMVPYSFTYTSHIIVTFAMALVVFIGVTIIGIAKHTLHFFSFFVPKGVPMAMVPLLVPIEVLSYLARPVTLALRLFANMMAGHAVILAFVTLIFILGDVFSPTAAWLASPISVGFALFVHFLELLVSTVQAYIFTMLTATFIGMSAHPAH